MELSIVIPAYNEEDNIETIIKQSLEFLSQEGTRSEIIVVDDGSGDNTFLLLQKLQEEDSRIRVLRHSVKKGMGSALLTGYKQARGKYLTWIPADGQIHPLQLNALFKEREKYDFVTAAYIQRADSWIRLFISGGWHLLIRFVLGYAVDFNGNYMFRRELLHNFSLRSTTALVNFELIYKAKAKRYRVKNVFISCNPRLSGHSKICNFRTVCKTFSEMLMLRFHR